MVRFWFIRLRLRWQVFASRFRLFVLRRPGIMRAARAAIVLTAVAAAAFWAWMMWPQTSLSASLATSGARKLTAGGHYDEALRDIDGHLRQSPGNKAWAALKDQLVKEMTVSLRLHYLRGNKLPVQSAERGKLTLSPSDT